MRKLLILFGLFAFLSSHAQEDNRFTEKFKEANLAFHQETGNKYTPAAIKAAKYTDSVLDWNVFRQQVKIASFEARNETNAELGLMGFTPNISPDVLPAYESIIKRGVAHNKDIRALMAAKGLLSITVVDTIPGGSGGRYIPVTNNTFKIIIAQYSLNDFDVLENILAHEIGHAAGLQHITEKGEWSAEVMAASIYSHPGHLVYQIMVHPQFSPGIWERFFNDL